MPRVKDPILTDRQIDRVSIVELRNSYRLLIAHYRKYKERLRAVESANSRFKIDRETAVKRAKERMVSDISRIRLAPVKAARLNNKRDIIRKAKAQGYKHAMISGLKRVKRTIYKAGYIAGEGNYKRKVQQSRMGIVNRHATVDSIARTGLMINKLSKALNISPEYVAIFLWAGEYDSFFFGELKSSMEAIGDDLFYKKIYYLKQKGYIQKIAHTAKGVIWALTPLGREIYLRVRAFLNRQLKEQKNENT